MELVVDTSIIIAVLCNEEHKNKIIEKTKNFDLVAPHSMHWEIGNALSAMLKQNRITIAQVKMILDQYKKISIRFIDIELDKSLETANK